MLWNESQDAAPAMVIDDRPPRVLTSDRIRIRRSDGRHEWVTAKELELLNESKHSQDLARQQERRWVLLLGMTAFVLVFVVAVVFIQHRVHEAASLAVETSLPVESAGAWAVPTGGAAATRTSEPRRSLEKEIERHVGLWAAAWASRDAERYLDFYSERFELPEGLSRKSWETMKRMRFMTSGDTRVAVSGLEPEVTGSDTAVVTFVETFTTPYTVDRVSKTLELVRESGRWKISAERSVPIQDPADQS